MKLFKRNPQPVTVKKLQTELPWPPESTIGYDQLGRLGAVPPHCDAMVLHEPGACDYCDQFIDGKAQALRQLWGIAFTGQDPQPGQVACPSDARRGTAGAHVWPGNTPRPEYPPIGLDESRQP